MTAHRLALRDLTWIAICAALICVCAWITVPSTVPFTLQLMGVFLSVRVLGGKNGTIAIAVYMLLGLVGLPVFAGFSAGAGVLLGPTGGYIIGFLFIGLIYWLGGPLTSNRLTSCALLLAGLLVCYVFGTAWFMYVYAAKGQSLTLLGSLSICVLPYVIPDVLKLAASEIIAYRVLKLLERKRV